jgi:phasin family protein
MPEAKSAKDGQKKVITLFGATQKFAQQGACFRDVSVKTKGTTGETPKAAGKTYLTFPSVIAEFHHQWIEMVRANTNNTLDFAHQVLRVESPAAFVEVSAEHARKQFETLGDQARHLTGLAQKLTNDLAAPMQVGVHTVSRRLTRPSAYASWTWPLSMGRSCFFP